MAAAAILDTGLSTTFDLCDLHMCVIYQEGGFECAMVINHVNFTIQTILAT